MGEPQTLREALDRDLIGMIRTSWPMDRSAEEKGWNEAVHACREKVRAALTERPRLVASPDSLRLDPEDPVSVEAMVRTLYRFYAGPSREHDPAYWQTRARNVLSAFVHWRGEVAREWKASAAPTEETPHE